jgi:hypothetical protein
MAGRIGSLPVNGSSAHSSSYSNRPAVQMDASSGHVSTASSVGIANNTSNSNNSSSSNSSAPMEVDRDTKSISIGADIKVESTAGLIGEASSPSVNLPTSNGVSTTLGGAVVESLANSTGTGTGTGEGDLEAVPISVSVLSAPSGTNTELA